MNLRVMGLTGFALLVSSCASDARRDDATVRPADRPECQVAASSSAQALARSRTSAMVNDPCHPEEALEVSSGRRSQDSIKPDFSGKHD